jgi:hypothetical protein
VDLERRIKRLEARAAIEELLARYCFVIDGRDIAGIGECFARDGSFRSIDGVMNATGREAVVEQFHGRFAVLGPSNHFTHDNIIKFDDADPMRASGLVNAHAELVRNGLAMWTSLRYHDEYVLEEECWRFRVRTLEFFYYLRPEEYAEGLNSGLRNRAYASPHPADYPEGLTSWKDYYRRRPRTQ